jgi:SAM-dependent methyltransferase
VQLNWLMRYQPVVRVLDSMPDGTVLDVGSGQHGLSGYRTGWSVQTDLAFRASATTGARRGTAAFVAASAESLPFAAGSFDYVVSLDMFEHLPAAVRDCSVRELCRVARRAVLVGFPVGRPAETVDAILSHLLRLGRRGCPDWLAEHRAQDRYPDRTMLSGALPPGWAIASELKSGNVATQTAVILAEHVPGARQMTERLETRWRERGVPRFVDRGLTYRTIFLVRPTREA